jgi:hypothetical protein
VRNVSAPRDGPLDTANSLGTAARFFVN